MTRNTTVGAIILLVGLASWGSAFVDSDLERPIPLRSWRFLFYLNGDSSFLAKDEILEASRAHFERLTALARKGDLPFGIAALLDEGKGLGGRSMVAGPSTDLEERRMESPNMGDGAVLQAFLTDAFARLPGERTCLVVAGHGTVAVPDRGVEFFNIKERYPLRQASLVYDEGSGEDCLTLQEAKAALSGVPRGIDVLVLDACHQNSLEAGYQFRECVLSMVATAGPMPGGGIGIGFLDALPAALAPADLARRIAEAPDLRIVRPPLCAKVVEALDAALVEGVGRWKYVHVPNRRAFRVDPRLETPGIDVFPFVEDSVFGPEEGPSEGDLLLSQAPASSLEALREALCAYQVAPHRGPTGFALYYPTDVLDQHVRPFLLYYGTLDLSIDSMWDDFVTWVRLGTNRL